MKYLLSLLLIFSLQANAADKDLMNKIMQCESSNKHLNVWGDGGKSYGIAQFQEATFYEFAHEAKQQMKNAKLWPPNWHNKAQQIFLLNWGLDNGYAERWTCFRKLNRKTK